MPFSHEVLTDGLCSYVRQRVPAQVGDLGITVGGDGDLSAVRHGCEQVGHLTVHADPAGGARGPWSDGRGNVEARCTARQLNVPAVRKHYLHQSLPSLSPPPAGGIAANCDTTR